MSGTENEAPLVLVAEDQPLASMALRAQLEALDYHVLGPAVNGDEAVALGSCYPVDFALFDHRMPRRSGVEAAVELFDVAPTPVVLLTGVGSADLPDPLPMPPIFGILTKPVELADVRSALGSAHDRFRRWAEDSGRADIDARRDQRATIARALDRLEDGRPATAAARFLERARAEGRDPHELARDILADADS